MLSLLPLFEETKDIHESKSFQKSHKYIKNINVLPDFNCPAIDSKQQEDDISKIKWYYHNKSLSKNFLTKSDDSVKKIYKMFCKENNINIDWKFLKELLKEVYSVVGILKNRHKRDRPKITLMKEDDEYSDIIDMNSYSFPSGHTTAAYFMTNIISNFYPTIRNELENLAKIIGQSRIENCVHYPSDVLYGQLLGEMLSDIIIKDNDIENDLYHYDIKKKDYKEVQKIFYDNFKKNKKFLYDISDYIHLTSNNNKNYYDDIKKFMQGYSIDYCCSDTFIEKFIKCIVISNKIKHNKNMFNYSSIHKFIDDKSYIRTNEKTKHGFLLSKPEDICHHISKQLNIDNPLKKFVIYNLIDPFENNNDIVSAANLLIDINFDISNWIEEITTIHKNFKNIFLKYNSIYDIF